MKTATILLWVLAGPVFSQTQINKSIPVSPGQQVTLRFDYPELIKITTWEKNEVSIEGTVSINGGENDDAFKLETGSEGNKVFVRNQLNLKGLPHRITVMNDGQKIVFKTKADWKKYQAEHGRDYNTYSEGVDLDITLEIKVPVNVQTFVACVYGMVEIKDFKGPIEVDATYGGVDVTMTEKTTGELLAETNYGHIYSNLDLSFGKSTMREEDFHTMVSAKPGTGPRYSFESKYGNVYLRKSK